MTKPDNLSEMQGSHVYKPVFVPMLGSNIIEATRRAAGGSRNCGAPTSGLVPWLQRKYSTTSIRPSSISLVKAPPPNPSYKGLELDYSDGEKFWFSAEFLRVYSPSAESMRTMASGKRKVISGRQHVQILGIEPVGKYGIRIMYDDTHDTGIYTWNYLHDLGSKKFHYMRDYVKSLREQGLSRDPLKRK